MINGTREWIATRWPGYLHGGAWKLAALACKFAFLIYFVPQMPDGEFSQFLFWQSAALLLARAVSVGMVDELPVRIRGNAPEARQFWPLLQGLQVASLGGLLIAWSTDSVMVAGLELVLVLVAASILQGIIITLRPSWYERALNWPWLFFIAFLAASSSKLAVHTLHLYETALFLSQIIAFFAVRSILGPIGKRRLIPVDLASLVRHGSIKMLSELTLLANARAPILLPVALVGSLQSDQVSYSLAIADALAGLFMVIVNRNYVLYCKHEAKAGHALISATFVIVAMTLLGGAALLASDLAPSLWPAQLRAMDLLWACVFFGAITAFYDVRYFFWARGTGVAGTIPLQLIALAGQAGLILLLPPSLWLPTTAIVFAVAVLGFGGMSLSSIGEATERK